VVTRIRWLVAGALFAAALRWTWLAVLEAWRSPPVPLTATDPETGLQLRIRLTPAELVDARARERATELVG
jgi:hypothetical protein